MKRSNPELERFKGILLEIAQRQPGLAIHEALVMAADIEETLERDRPSQPTDDTPVEIAAKWCRHQPVVVDEILAGRKIHAIKEARQLSGMGLYATKQAIEYMEAHLLP